MALLRKLSSCRKRPSFWVVVTFTILVFGVQLPPDRLRRPTGYLEKTVHPGTTNLHHPKRDDAMIPPEGPSSMNNRSSRNLSTTTFGDTSEKEIVQSCIVPKLSLSTDHRILRRVKPVKCEGIQVFSTENGMVHFNNLAAKGLKLTHCEYQGILWETDKSIIYTKAIRKNSTFDFTISHDFFIIRCYSKSKLAYEQYFAEIVENDMLLNRKKKKEAQYNVLVFGFDSMSRLAFERRLPKVFHYLKETLDAVILNAYNIVGDATIKALVPLLTGKEETELPNVQRGTEGSDYVDVYPMIWYDFKRYGFVTMFAEDRHRGNTFNLRFTGFRRIPTDHYMRPFWHAADGSRLAKKSNDFCLGGIPKNTYMQNYTKKFMEGYKDIPKFAFVFSTDNSHDEDDPVESVDQVTVDMLDYLRSSGILNDTFLIVMADHGARYGKFRQTVQGKLEERLPMMSFIPPHRFRQEHPDNVKHLMQNIDRLSTPFDVHETMLDILKPERLTERPNPGSRGLSLLREIPLNRTCDSAAIAVHWCSCLNWQNIPISNMVKRMAKAVVKKLNALVEDHLDICQHLTLKEIKVAATMMPNEKVIQFRRTFRHKRPLFSEKNEVNIKTYQVTIETAPNNGLYEATVQHRLQSDEIIVDPDMSRINVYGSQADCVVETLPHLRKYCHCKNSTTS